MAEAYVGFSPDANAIEYNPAGISSIVGTEVWFTHLQYFERVGLESLTFAKPFRRGTLGLNTKFLHLKDTARDAFGNSQGDFINWDLAQTFAVSYRLRPNLFVGASGKILLQKLANSRAAGVAGDLGVHYSFPKLQSSMGISVQNIGPSLKFIQERDPMPLSVLVGGAIRIKTRVVAAMDFKAARDERPQVKMGVEYQAVERLRFRAGYAMKTGRLEGHSGLSAGMGWRFGSAYLDYAFTPSQELGLSHRLSLGFRFAPSAAASRVRPPSEIEKPAEEEPEEKPPKEEKEEEEEEREETESEGGSSD